VVVLHQDNGDVELFMGKGSQIEKLVSNDGNKALLEYNQVKKLTKLQLDPVQVSGNISNSNQIKKILNPSLLNSEKFQQRIREKRTKTIDIKERSEEDKKEVRVSINAPRKNNWGLDLKVGNKVAVNDLREHKKIIICEKKDIKEAIAKTEFAKDYEIVTLGGNPFSAIERTTVSNAEPIRRTKNKAE
jgi:hypothetical protein